MKLSSGNSLDYYTGTASSFSLIIKNGSSRYTSTESSGPIPSTSQISLSNSGGGTWLYKRPIVITNNSSSSISDYQIQVNPFISSAFTTAYNSIRFTKSDGTEIPYWQESTTSYWIKYTGSLPTGTSTIYMYYGNTSAVQSGAYANNGSNTFLAFDDFSDGSISANWSSLGGNGTISESSGTINFSYNGLLDNDWWTWGRPEKILKLNSLPSADFSADVYLSSYQVNWNVHAGIGAYANDGTAYLFGRYTADWYDEDCGCGGSENNYVIESIGGRLATYENTSLPAHLSIKRVGSVWSFNYSTNGLAWTQVGSVNDANINSLILFGKEWGGDDLSFSMDNFKIHKYISNAPSYTPPGAEVTL